jgi:hypothetical protein
LPWERLSAQESPGFSQGEGQQGIFAELYRRFGVSTYKLLRVSQYHDVRDFLEDWRQTALQGKRPEQGSLF